MLKIWSLIFICFSFLGAATRPGAVFLLIWPGARATAMSGAFSAIADDGTACYYNQAGLSFIDSNQIVTLQHAPWLAGLHPGMYYEYAGFTKPIRSGTLGFNIIYLTTGETEVIDFDGNYLGKYTTFDISLGLNYGFKLLPQMGIGIGWKLIYSYLVAPWVWGRMPELGIRSGGIGLAYAFDTGIIYKPFNFVSLACALQNFGPNIRYTESGASDPLPYTLRFGVQIQPVNSKVIKVSLTGDITKILVGMFADEDNTFMENLRYEIKEAWKGTGLEINYFDFVLLRGGYFYDYEGQRIGFTFGGGIKAGGFSLDVGVDEAMYDFTTTNRKFSLSYRF